MKNFMNTKPVRVNTIPLKLGVEIQELDKDQFLKLCETLTRIGEPLDDGTTIKQLCYCLYKNDRYFIAHHKELETLDGEGKNLNLRDILARNEIVKLLESWGMISLIDRLPYPRITVVQYKDKEKYNLISPWKFKYRNENSGFKSSQNK